MINIEEIRQYFQKSNKRDEPLVPLKKSCHDCAVDCGFYKEFSESLSKLTADEIKYYSERWFCHNNPSRACAGNIEYLKSLGVT